jgi:hypothetical protein
MIHQSKFDNSEGKSKRSSRSNIKIKEKDNY